MNLSAKLQKQEIAQWNEWILNETVCTLLHVTNLLGPVSAGEINPSVQKANKHTVRNETSLG